MIHQNVIKRRADEDGLSASAVERDYVLAHSLTAISERDREQRLVFKGGTALRLCHFENRDPDRFGESFADRVLRWEERWDRELVDYIASPPAFDGVLRAVRRELRFALAN